MTVIGIAKKLEEIYYPNDPLPMYLDKKSETLRIIQQMRDEAHRFGITHHRRRREKGTIKAVLTGDPGDRVLDTTRALLWKFKSVKNIKLGLTCRNCRRRSGNQKERSFMIIFIRKQT